MSITHLIRLGGSASLLYLGLFLAPVSTVSVAEPTEPSMRLSGERVEIPFEEYFGLIILKVQVNGSEPVDFILDTGFGESILNADRCAALGLSVGEAEEVEAPGGRVSLARVEGVHLSLPGVQIFETNLATIPLAGLEPIPGRAIWGILGHPFFERFVVEIDYERGVLAVLEPASWNPTDGGEVIDLEFEANQAFFTVQLEQPGRKSVPAQMKIDTGSVDAAGFNGSFIWALDVLNPGQPQIPALGTAVGGHTENWVTRLGAIQVGKFRMENPVVGYSEDRTRVGDAGTLGADILRRFRVVLDYPRSRLHLYPNHRLLEPFEYDWSGLFPAAEPPEFRVKTAFAVAPNSPAARAGLLVGDQLVTIDGVSVEDLSIADLRRLLLGPSRLVVLEVRREGELRRLEIELRRRI